MESLKPWKRKSISYIGKKSSGMVPTDVWCHPVIISTYSMSFWQESVSPAYREQNTASVNLGSMGFLFRKFLRLESKFMCQTKVSSGDVFLRRKEKQGGCKNWSEPPQANTGLYPPSLGEEEIQECHLCTIMINIYNQLVIELEFLK